MKKFASAFAVLVLLFASSNVFAQSGDLISTAGVGVWDYYIFNENSGLWSSMNGLAAWFNASSGFIRGTAILGALIGILIFMFSAISGNSKITGKHLVTWFFLLSTLGLTGTARVTNMYNGQVTIIDNVPALALVPASLFSTGGYKVFVGLDAALQSASGSYMAVSSQGFVGPLDVLLTLRSGKSLAARPNLNKSLAQVISDCGNNPDKVASVPLARSSDALAWLAENGRHEGITRIFTATDASQTGTIVGCKEGLDYINAQFTTLATGGSNAESSLAEQINQGSNSKRSVNSERGVGGTRYTNGQAMEARDAGFGMLVSAAVSTQQSAVMFTKNAMTASMISGALDCINQTGSITTPDICQASAMGMADGLERFNTDSVMAGQGFLKTMFTSMGFLQALFFGMFPIVVIFGLLMMSQIPKVLGGYLFFGAWCQSWLLVVAPIQAYVQNSVLEDINRTIGSTGGVSPGLTLGNVNATYQVLSMKLAMAADLMASSQMLSLAILSGSMIAMSSLANKWSGARQMDSSLMQPKTADSGSLVKHAPMHTTQSISDGKGGMSTIVSGNGASGASVVGTVVRAKNVTSGGQASQVKTQALTQSIATQIQKTHGNTLTNEESRGIASDVTSTIKSQMGVNGALGAFVNAAFMDQMKKNGYNLGAGEMKKMAPLLEQAQAQAVKKLAAQDSNFMANISNGTPEKRAESYASIGADAVATVGAEAVALLAGRVGASSIANNPASKAAVKETIKGGMKGFLQKTADKGRELAEKGQQKGGGAGAAMTAMGLGGAAVMKASDLAASMVKNNITPLAQATTDAAIKESRGWKSSAQSTTGKQASVNFGESFNEQAQAAFGNSYGVNASSGVTETVSIPMDNANMNTYAQDEGLRQNAAAARADLASGMTQSQIANTMNKVDQAMRGHSYSNPSARQFAENTFFTNFASGGDVSAIFKEGGNAFGITNANSNAELNGDQPGKGAVGKATSDASHGRNAEYNAAVARIDKVNTGVGSVDAAFENGRFTHVQGEATKNRQDVINITNVGGETIKRYIGNDSGAGAGATSERPVSPGRVSGGPVTKSNDNGGAKR